MVYSEDAIRTQPEVRKPVTAAVRYHLVLALLCYLVVESCRLLVSSANGYRLGSVSLKKSSRNLEPNNNNSSTASSAIATKVSTFCSSQQIAEHGRWIPVTFPEAPYQPSTFLDPGCHEPYENVTMAFSQRPWHSFEWQVDREASGCHFTRFQRQQYCQVMRNKSLTIVGDSLSFEHFASLAGYLGVDVSRFRRVIFKLKYNHMVFPVCENNSSKLVWQSTSSYHELHANMSLTDPVPDVLLLNVGAHYKPDSAYIPMRKNNIHRLQQWQDDDPTRLLIYRTTVPGIPHCEKYTLGGPEGPNVTFAEMEAVVNTPSYYSGRRSQHHWMDFQHQNELMLSLLSDSTLRYDVIRAYDVNLLRPDGTPDCLHNCEMNGKMEFYNDNLLHILLERFSG